jgi:hypothetical protein
MRALTLAHLVATLRDYGAIDTPAEAADVTAWGQWLHPARLTNAYGIALQLESAGLATFDSERTRAQWVRAFAPHAKAWRHHNTHQGCLPGIATPLPMSRKADDALALVA